jgi:Na+/proline symporter
MDQDSKETTMNRIRHIARLTTALAGLALTWLGLAAAAPAAFAANYPLPANHGQGASVYTPPPVVHTVIVGGMPGWQIALIAAGAALAAATAAVLAYRALATRRQPATATA